jgi:diacylglycerol kinase family enzyme
MIPGGTRQGAMNGDGGAHSGGIERALLIVNPKASQVTAERIAQVERLLGAVCGLETMLTTGRLDARRIAEQASSDSHLDALFVYSGDGGFNEVINGLGRILPVGFIPGGHTNVLTRSLGLGRDGATAAARLADAAREGRRRRISLGRANGRRFATSSGLGLDAALVRRWDRVSRRRDGNKRGDLAFAAAAAELLVRMRGAMAATVEVDGAGAASFVLAANTDPYSYAGAMPLHVAPGVTLESGIELVAVGELTPRMIPGLIRLLVFGNRAAARGSLIRLPDLNAVEVRCSAPLPFHVDGEDLGDVTEVLYETERAALEVIV